MMLMKAAGVAKALSFSINSGRCSWGLSSASSSSSSSFSAINSSGTCRLVLLPRSGFCCFSTRRGDTATKQPRLLSSPRGGYCLRAQRPPIPRFASAMSARDKKDDEDREIQGASSRLLTLPTILTLGRVAAVPLLVAGTLICLFFSLAFYLDRWWASTATTGIFLAAAATDWLDGYLARKMKLGTAFGAFLDPVADKLMVATTLVLLCSRPLEVALFGHVPWLLTVPSIIIIGREIAMSAVREWAASQDTSVIEAVAVSNLGKWKTATQMTALTILLAARDSSQGGPNGLATCGVALLYVSSGLTLLSLVAYMKGIWRILLQ
ncbi:CDP-diacylglycerol--glycerol-3-phosphate 3-phosphatidyltransferase 1 [Nymphaea thermarum]|nr:CDP-diacylglycerol--glycerol-3-phosphate 3-phosphatidyltransferase 1 [Nymphaea thermarum]